MRLMRLMRPVRLSWSGLGTAIVALALVVGTAGQAAAASTDLSVSVSASPGSITANDTVTVTATVTNAGPEVGETHVSVSAGPEALTVSAPGATCTVTYQASCTFGALAAGQSVAVTATYRLDDAGQETFTADVWTWDDEDTNSSNDSAETTVTVAPVVPVLGLRASAAQVGFGDQVTLTATAGAWGAPAPVSLQLYRRTAVDAAPVLVDETWAQGGTATFSDSPGEQAEYLVRSVAENSYGAAASPAVVVRVSSSVSTVVSPIAVPPGGVVSLTARVQPAVPGATVVVQERFGTAAWRTVATPVMDADGRVRVTLGRRSKVGTYALRVTRPSDSRLVEGSGEGSTVVTVTGAGKGSAWRSLSGSKRRPSHWGTCRIGFRVNPKQMPAHGMSDLREAMRRVTQVSGMRFRYLGTTKRMPYAGDGRAGPNRITVAWGTMRQTKGLLPPGVAGVGGTSQFLGGRIVTGFLAISTSYARSAPAGFGEGSPHGMVLMHELGHVVGLDHPPDHRQVMNASSALPAAVWGAGDLTGLRTIGRAGGCR